MNDQTSVALAWWSHSQACYHEPKIHDHELYFSLRDLNLYLLLPIAILGIIFNAGAMVFLYRPPKITSGVLVYLKALLILDHLLLVVSTASILLPQICDLHHSATHSLYSFCMFERRFLKYTMPRIESTISMLHVWTIAALSAHRYWKISRPVISRLKDTVHRARSMLIALFVLVLTFRSPTFLIELEFKLNPKFRISKRIAATEVLSPYRFLYHSILNPLFQNILPFAWMSLFSVLTLREIYRSRHFNYKHMPLDGSIRSNGLTYPLALCFRRKAEILRQKQELRATMSIVLIILLYLGFHSLQLYTVGRKWHLLITHQCPTRSDYFHSHLGLILSLVSASVNAFVFIAFANRLKQYLSVLIRKTSRTFSNSSDPPLSPKTTVTLDSHNHAMVKDFPL